VAFEKWTCPANISSGGIMKPTVMAFLMLIASSPLRAQTPTHQGLTSQPNQTDSALTAETRQVFQSILANILKAAQQMPEQSYRFKPASDARTFGELLAHIANVQTTLCADINGHPQAHSGTQQQSKEKTIKDLEASTGECDIAFGELSAENMSKRVQTPAGQLTHLAALMYIITHASDAYGQLTVYPRLNHLAPPTTDMAKGVM
jgi:uncharacterized damage-inducible protein DinB